MTLKLHRRRPSRSWHHPSDRHPAGSPLPGGARGPIDRDPRVLERLDDRIDERLDGGFIFLLLLPFVVAMIGLWAWFTDDERDDRH